MTQFKGWHVLGAGFINAMLLAGASIYAFGLFINPIVAEFGYSHEQVYLGIIVFYFSMAFWAATIGRLMQRISARQFTLAGGLAFALGYILMSQAQSPVAMLAVMFIFTGFGFTAAGPFMANALATDWFLRLRGRALGIAAVATSAGGFVIVPLFGKLIDLYGWRTALLYMGLAVLVITALLARFVIVAKPEDIGQHPDGDAAQAETISQTETAEKPKLITDRNFWLIALGCGLLLSSDQALITSLIPHIQEEGFTRAQATGVISAMTGSAILGKLVIGWLTDSVDNRLLFAFVCLTNILFLIALLMSPSHMILILVAAMVGLAVGGVYPVWTNLTALCFGRAGFTAAIGSMNLITVPCILVALWLTGRTHDMVGTYDLAYQIFIPQVVLAAIIVGFVRVKA